ncbi:hypothetical protein [Glaciecola petra]|uniref:PEP-CTERM sorting domain-containing protein n=1 Tax=Glaciecola petra TaxID=3075602 RepID=A0ABU2ZQE0_9ALTE|nr:hypothetical protein [Aestuariibacter sp. P117]MDT0594820.1 hypothetical protein [Aestuariibacter sp. P117]
MTNKIRSLLLGSLVLCSSVANAVVIEFDDYKTSFTQFTFRNIVDVMPGVDLNIEAAVFSNNSSVITDVDTGNSNNRRLGLLDDDGLGVVGINTDQGGRVDGNSGNDLLIFTFSRAVMFTGIGFTDFGNSDDFEFGLIEGNMFNRILSNEDVSQDVSFSGYYGTTFGVGAVQSNDSFRLSSISVVSAPATLALFAICLAALGLRKRALK